MQDLFWQLHGLFTDKEMEAHLILLYARNSLIYFSLEPQVLFVVVALLASGGVRWLFSKEGGGRIPVESV